MGVHNISKDRLLIEFTDRRMPIPPFRYFVCKPPVGIAAKGVHVGKSYRLPCGESHIYRGTCDAFEEDANGGRYIINYEEIDMESMDCQDFQTSFQLGITDEEREIAYILHLREILQRRLIDEEELERLTMYARDPRFSDDVNRPKWEPHRILIDMLHCLMRMHEKVLFLLYFAAMNRCAGNAALIDETLDRLTTKTREIGKLPPKWTHTLDTDKRGNAKLLPFKMNYDTSKKIFHFNTLPRLYELINIAVVEQSENDKWRAFIVSYLNCMAKITANAEYTRSDVDELDVLCKTMYHLLITTIGGLEGCTNYFHIIGSGHVVWMAREYGNLWRYRNEGVEAFNKIVSLRYNKFNKRGGYNKTRRGQVSKKCDEFWSLGQWLGRWSMWHLGYADSMKHEHLFTVLDDGLSASEGETDDTYNVADDSDSDCTGSEGLDDDFDLDPLGLFPTRTLTTVLESRTDCDTDCDDDSNLNGLGYTSSDDDASDDTDNSQTFDRDVEEEDNSNDEGVKRHRTRSSPFHLSTRESRAQNFYVRACNGLSGISSLTDVTRNVVHAAS